MIQLLQSRLDARLRVFSLVVDGAKAGFCRLRRRAWTIGWSAKSIGDSKLSRPSLTGFRSKAPVELGAAWSLPCEQNASSRLGAGRPQRQAGF